MSEWLKAFFRTDDVYDEDNAKYRFCFNSAHCLHLTKATLSVHGIFTLFPILYYLPYSIPTIPIYLVVSVASIYGIKRCDSLALLPLQIYVVTLFTLSAATLVVDPLIVYYSRSDIYELFSFEGRSPYIFLLLILSNVFMFHLTLTFLLFWQYQALIYCRDYMSQQREMVEYSKLSVPSSFLNTQITESTPIATKNPNYAIFTLGNNEEKPDLINPN